MFNMPRVGNITACGTAIANCLGLLQPAQAWRQGLRDLRLRI